MYNRTAEGQPSLWCPWLPSCNGTCLVLDDEARLDAPVAWLEYLIEHFLRPAAVAEGRSEFAEFSFDHHVSGSVAMHRASDGEDVWMYCRE